MKNGITRCVYWKTREDKEEERRSKSHQRLTSRDRDRESVAIVKEPELEETDRSLLNLFLSVATLLLCFISLSASLIRSRAAVFERRNDIIINERWIPVQKNRMEIYDMKMYTPRPIRQEKKKEKKTKQATATSTATNVDDRFITCIAFSFLPPMKTWYSYSDCISSAKVYTLRCVFT